MVSFFAHSAITSGAKRIVRLEERDLQSSG